jgi:serine/threonine protein phosphatase PrpC
MGNTYSISNSPKTHYLIKNNNNIKINNQHIHVTACSIQGYRDSMEDFYDIYYIKEKFLGVGVYDGHSGSSISEKLSYEFIKSLYKKINDIQYNNTENYIDEINKMIKLFFINYDNILRQSNFIREGSTAVILLLINDYIFIANCGDSRCVLYNGHAITIMTKDHKPNDPIEFERISKTNHFVSESRIDNNINISRTFGDFAFKTNKNINAIIADPDVYNGSVFYCKFAILMSDGITNIIQNEKICKYIANRLCVGEDTIYICKNIINYCLYYKSRDNMSIILILFSKYEIDEKYKLLDDKENEKIKKYVVSIFGSNSIYRKIYNYDNVMSLVKELDKKLKLKTSVSFKVCMIKKYYKQLYKQFK